MIKEDCFAYIQNKNKCYGLKELYCKKENCNFYKNKSELNIADIERDVRSYVYIKK